MGTGKDHLRKGENVQFSKSLLAGALSGLLARSVTAPIDTLKIRLQVHHTKDVANSDIRITTMVRNMLKQEGLYGFWKGNIPGSFMYVIYSGVQFGSYSYYNTLLFSMQLSPQMHSITVGAVTGMTSSFFSYPFDILRTRFAVNKSQEVFRMTAVIRNIYIAEGYRGFFHGLTASLWTVALSTSVMFGTYESIKIFCESSLKNLDSCENSDTFKKKLLYMLNSSAGTLGGVTSKVLTFPLDTIRRRIQLRDSRHLTKYSDEFQIFQSYKGNSFLNVGSQIIRQEGAKALFRGMTMGLIKTIPNTTISLWAYEYFITLLN